MNWQSIATVTFVIFLILVFTISYCSLYLPTLFKQNTTSFYILTSFFAITHLLGSYSYFRAVFTSPGYPSPTLKTQYSSQQILCMKSRRQQQKQYKRLLKQKTITPQITIKQIHNLHLNSYCQKCDNVKLSRVHHCKQCNTCIQRMDHHCPWVGNCVGKHNHKYFFLFLLYIQITILIVWISIVVDYLNSQQPILRKINQIDQLYYIITLITGGLCILLSISIGFLLVSQFTLIFVYNLTTLESFYDKIYQINPFQSQTSYFQYKNISGNSFILLPTKPFPQHQDSINVAFKNHS